MSPVVILGAGINGAALARELALNGLDVVVVDAADLASGATAYSSRLIHGGLRYLEYGEFDLVRESLEERTRLLKLAPQFVQPLRLFIPVAHRLGGLGPTIRRFLGWETKADRRRNVPRGLWLVRMGLRLYDTYARDPSLPRYEVHPAKTSSVPGANRQDYRWFCAYWDAQIRFPERFVVALFNDARRAAVERGASFELLTYHHVRRDSDMLIVRSHDATAQSSRKIRPSAVINATGAWVDLTLAQIETSARKLMGGTKGSHLVTHNARLREALRGDALYAEAADGRPVFVLPLGDATLIGTTDERYEGDPRDATASPEEVRYLLETVNRLVPEAKLTETDIAFHYSGVRPLPAVDASKTSAITRRHWLEEHSGAPWPLYSVIGGKLTTCRSLAEGAARTILSKLGVESKENSSNRPLPGAENYPAVAQAQAAQFARWSSETKLTSDQIAAMWPLVGTEIDRFLRQRPGTNNTSLQGTSLPVEFIHWIIDQEWVATLSDLVERRLMLMYQPQLSAATLCALAEILTQRRPSDSIQSAAQVTATANQLRTRYGLELRQ
jgi:glycerol-3-phosphate dehydrogenase